MFLLLNNIFVLKLDLFRTFFPLSRVQHELLVWVGRKLVNRLGRWHCQIQTVIDFGVFNDANSRLILVVNLQYQIVALAIQQLNNPRQIDHQDLMEMLGQVINVEAGILVLFLSPHHWQALLAVPRQDRIYEHVFSHRVAHQRQFAELACGN